MQFCRLCGSDSLIDIINLNHSPLANSFLTIDQLDIPSQSYPLKLIYCNNCQLAQTRDYLSSKDIFSENYPYLSSTSSTWCLHAENLVSTLVSEFNLSSSSLVGEVASNDGYLLQYLEKRNIPNYGVEPTRLAAQISINRGHAVYESFLTKEIVRKIQSERGLADVLIANNVFAHVPNLVEFTKNIVSLIKLGGVLVAEVQYFPQLLSELAFDTIYHEHFSYFTAYAFNYLFRNSGLEVLRFENLSTHGGSLRVLARKVDEGLSDSASVEAFLAKERLLLSHQLLNSFQDKVDLKRREIRAFITKLNLENCKVACLGAAAKGNTLLNFCGLNSLDISFVMDSALSKQGKFLPGSHIPIQPFIPEYVERADVLIVLPWNLSKEFLAKIEKMPLQNCPSVYSLLPEIVRIG